jgi:hypothetical protein
MRLAQEMLELTCPAEIDAAMSLSSLARATPPCSSASVSKTWTGPQNSWASPRANRSSSSTSRTGESPHTVSVIAVVRRLASRRLGSGSTDSSASRNSTRQSTMGSSACGRSCSSQAASAIS